VKPNPTIQRATIKKSGVAGALTQRVASFVVLGFAGLLTALYSIPFARAPAYIYAALGLALAPFLLGKRTAAVAVSIVGLYGYQILVTAIATRRMAGVMPILAHAIVQAVMALLVLVVVDRCSSKVITRILGVIVGIALVSVLLDSLGVDLHRLIPSTVKNAETYFEDGMNYASGDARLRGVYAEPGALGAVIGGIAGVCYLGLVFGNRGFPAMQKLMAWIIGLGCVLCLAVVLTKAGMIVIIGAVVGAAACVVFFPNISSIMRLGVTILVVVVGGLIAIPFVPPAMKDYLLDEGKSFTGLAAGEDISKVSGKGLFGRSEGYEIGFKSLFTYPLGTSESGAEKVVEKWRISITNELDQLFSHEIYGLKSTIANIALRGGFVGLGFLFYFFYSTLSFVKKRAGGEAPYTRSPIMWGAVFSLIAFLMITEGLYYVFGFCILILAAAAHYDTFRARSKPRRRPVGPAFKRANRDIEKTALSDDAGERTADFVEVACLKDAGKDGDESDTVHRPENAEVAADVVSKQPKASE
jgi:hypothetical protein